MRTMKQVGIALLLQSFLFVAGATESATEWFRDPSVLLSSATCVSDTNAFTCGSAPISCAHDGMIYAPYLTARSGHGEQHKVIALSVFPAENPQTARSFVIAEAGAAGPASDCSQVIDQFSVWQDGKVRVYFLADAEYYRFCDYNPATHAVSASSSVKCVWSGAATNELTSVPVAAYLTAKGCTGFNLKADASEHLICTAKPAWHNGAFYGTVTSGSSQPVVFRCADGETFEFVGVVPVIGQYECQIAWLGDTLYALVRSAAGGRNFWTSSDGGATWTHRASIAMSATRPQLLAWRDKLLVGYSEENVEPNRIRAGRNNMRIKVGTGTDFDAFEDAFRVVDPIGFVYYDLVPCGDDLYCLWSNSSVYPDLGGTLSGKDAVFAARLSVPDDGGGTGIEAFPCPGGLDIVVDGSLVGSTAASLLLTWDGEDRGESIEDWAHRSVVVPLLDATGGNYLVDVAALGVADGDTCRCFVVPSYRLLDYLGSTGSQYLDTHVKHQADDVVELELTMTAAGERDGLNAMIYGSRDDSDGFLAVEVFQGYANSGKGAATTYADFRNDRSASYRMTATMGDSFVPYFNRRFTMRLDAVGSQIDFADGGFSGKSQLGYGEPFVCGRSAYVFSVNGAGWALHPGLRVHDIRITRAGEPLRHFVPALRPDGEAGLLDLVTEDFLANLGSGDFVTGEVADILPRIGEPEGMSPPVTVTLGGDSCMGAVTGWSGDYDGRKHAASVQVLYPKAGATIRWAWTGNPAPEDFTHDRSEEYLLPGVHTNVVRIADGDGVLAPWVGTGVVEIVRLPVMALSEGSTLIASVAPGVATADDALFLAWGDADAGTVKLGDWPHWAALTTDISANGGKVVLTSRQLRRLGVPEKSICRFFVQPSYEALEYAESSSSSQHVDLGCVLKSTYTAEVEAEVSTETNVTGPFGIFGARNAHNEVNFSIGADQNCAYADNNNCGNGDRVPYQAKASPLVKGARYRFHVGTPCSVSGAGTATASRGWTGTSFTTATAWLFGINQSGSPAFTASTGVRIYSCVVSNDVPSLLVDARPAKNASGEVCIYDAAFDQFLPCVGTGNLSAGPSLGRRPRLKSRPTAVSQTVMTRPAPGMCLMLR